MALLGGCGTDVVELYQSRSYEPISCSPRGFTLYNVDGFMWEYEVDTLGWSALAKPKGFSKEWAAESSTEKPVYIQHFFGGVHYVYDSRLVTVRGEARTEYLLQGKPHTQNFFQMQDGVVSVHDNSLDGLKKGDRITSFFAFCDFRKSQCETKLWPRFIDVAGNMPTPLLLIDPFDSESYLEFLDRRTRSDIHPNTRSKLSQMTCGRGSVLPPRVPQWVP